MGVRVFFGGVVLSAVSGFDPPAPGPPRRIPRWGNGTASVESILPGTSCSQVRRGEADQRKGSIGGATELLVVLCCSGG